VETPFVCEHRGPWLEDPDHPLKRQGDGSGYFLLKVDSDRSRTEYPITYCFFCGDRVDGQFPTAELRAGVCSCIQSHAEDPACPVEWDALLNQYFYSVETGKGRMQHFMYCCPWCGTRLPSQRRPSAP